MIAAIIEKRNYLHFRHAHTQDGTGIRVSNIKLNRLGSTNPPISVSRVLLVSIPKPIYQYCFTTVIYSLSTPHNDSVGSRRK